MSPLEFMQHHVGIREEGRDNHGPPARIFCGGRREAWCAHAVATAHRQAGTPLPGDVSPTLHVANPIASVRHMMLQLEKAGRLLPPIGQSVVEWIDADAAPSVLRWLAPVPGQLVFFAWRVDSDASKSGHALHVEIVERFDPDSGDGAGTIHTIGGNLSDKTAARGVVQARRQRTLGHPSITGFGVWP